MLHPALEKKILFTLQIAVAMCFIGHGTFGIITKPIWCNYFAVFGIGPDRAYHLMPVLGCFDILAGLVMLIYPVRAIPLWLVIWGVITAALRPLSGEPFAEFIERAGNFGAPLAYLLLVGEGKGFRGWFTRVSPDTTFSPDRFARAWLCLRVVAFLLLLGHGWLNIIEKKGLLGQYAALGFPNPGGTASVVGLFEILAAFSVLILPLSSVLMTLLVWKAASELFYPHFEIVEWIERGGSYGTLLALWFMSRARIRIQESRGLRQLV
jgi:hypothetical protein